MDRITRKDLKTDKFALEVEHTVEYVAGHRKAVTMYTAIGLAVVVLVAGIFFFRKHQRTVRQQALANAMQVMEAPVGPAPADGGQSFPTPAAKNAAVQKALAGVASEHAGSDEGIIARSYMAANAADQGNLAEAEKAFKEVAESGNEKYASLAKVSLADLYKSQGKVAEAEALLRSLVDKPTAFVSKDAATLLLGQLLAPSKPAEARKLLEPLAAGRGPASRQAMTAIGELQQK